MKKKILTCLLCGVMLLGIVGCSDNQPKENDTNKPMKEENLGSVEQESVNTLIAKLNTEIMDNGINTPAYDDYMVIENGLYWFALTEDVSFYIKPVTCSNDKNTDIAEMSAIWINKQKYDEDTALKYAKRLIKANNLELSEMEVESLLKEAQQLKNDKLLANNGKGIYVGILESDKHYEYQVKRIYK